MKKSVNCCLFSKSTRRNVSNGEFKHHLKAYCQGRFKVQILFVEPADRHSTNLLQKQS